MGQYKLVEQPDLKGRVVLITGAGDGIGKAVAERCGRLGATVVLIGKTTAKLEQVYDDLLEAGSPEPAIYPIDLEGAGPDDYKDMCRSIKKVLGKLDAIFHNAGWLGASSPIEHYDVELWYKVMQINLIAPFLLTQACTPLLKASDNATIVFNADDKQSAYWGAYGVAKSGCVSLMRILADELESSEVKVNAFNPIAVRSNFRTRAYPGEDASLLPKPEDVANYYAALLSGEPAISGKVLDRDDFS